MNKEWLRGKTVLISGAGQGIGKYLAYDLIKQYNCRVIGVDIDEVALSNLKTKLNDEGEEFDYYVFNAKVEANWTKLSAKFDEENVLIDVLVNAIGQSPKFKKFNDYTQKETADAVATNLYSCIFAIKALHENMKQSRTPAIINLCCATANMGIKGSSVYSASKSALKCYTEVLQQELENFYVGLFILGFVKTDFWKNQNQTVEKKIVNRAISPMRASAKIISAMNKRKKRAVIGVDAYLTDRLIRIMPYRARKLINKYFQRKKYRFVEETKNGMGEEQD